MAVGFVTGAGSGIGKACAQVLAERGDAVICLDLNLDAATATAAAFPDAIAVQADVRDLSQCTEAFARGIAMFGEIETLVACAGIEEHAPAHEMSEATFDKVMDVNLKGSFICAQLAGRSMIKRGGGFVVLIGSILSAVAHPNDAAYVASKGGVLQLARALAIDWAKYSITVNCIGPGIVDTPLSAQSLADPDKRVALLARVPLARAAAPREIAEVAAFLASPKAAYITGAYIPVDGGWLAAG